MASEYEVNWAVGGRIVFEANSAEEVYELAKDNLPPDSDWIDIDITAIETP